MNTTNSKMQTYQKHCIFPMDFHQHDTDNYTVDNHVDIYHFPRQTTCLGHNPVSASSCQNIGSRWNNYKGPHRVYRSGNHSVQILHMFLKMKKNCIYKGKFLHVFKTYFTAIIVVFLRKLALLCIITGQLEGSGYKFYNI